MIIGDAGLEVRGSELAPMPIGVGASSVQKVHLPDSFNH